MAAVSSGGDSKGIWKSKKGSSPRLKTGLSPVCQFPSFPQGQIINNFPF